MSLLITAINSWLLEMTKKKYLHYFSNDNIENK